MRQKITILFLVLVLGVPVLSMAQTGMGSITGHVSDRSGALIPGATVTATNTATGVSIDTVTNGSGIYLFQQLIPGSYQIEASAKNFKKFVRSNILVQSEDKIGLDVKLEVGSETETVTVTAALPQLRHEDAQSGEVVNNGMIENLPTLSGNQGRDPFQLMVLSGDVQGSGQRAGINFGIDNTLYDGQKDTRINGGRSGSIEYLVDGVPASSGFTHSIANDTPAMEAVDEFKVVTNGFSAEYGRLSGGLLSITTKSGTNEYHGQAFEYNQEALYNANTWGNDAACAAAPGPTNRACSKPNFRLNDFGFAVGGPIKIPHVYDGKNRTFFFFNYEGTRQSSSGNSNIEGTITDAERTGDLTDIGYCDGASPSCTQDPWAKVYDPTQPLDANGNRVLAGGDGRHIPAGKLDPIIQQYIKHLPHPTKGWPGIAGHGVAGNYLGFQPTSEHNDVWAVRVDHQINSKQRIFGRFSHNNGYKNTGSWFNPKDEDVPLDESYGAKNKNGFGAELHYDYTINPTTIFGFQLGGNYSPWSTGLYINSPIKSSSFGYGATEMSLVDPNDMITIGQGPFNEGWYTSCANGCQFSDGLKGNSGNVVNATNYDVSAALTKVLNRHTLKFGYDERRYYDNIIQKSQSLNTNYKDGFNFDASAVTQNGFGQGAGWSQQDQDNGVGQFLLGVETLFRFPSKLARGLSNNYYAAYVQDDFKVNSKLTLNLGLRWETETPVQERHDRLTVWDPNAKSPFTMASGYTWAGALAAATITDPVSGNQVPLTPAQQQSIATPSWVASGGFPTGAIEAVNTPQHPSRGASIFHPFNFSPRLGFAYQVDPKTVVRGSFGVMFIPTSGGLNRYGDSPGVNYSSVWNNVNTQYEANNGCIGGSPGCPGTAGVYQLPRTMANPWTPDQHIDWSPDFHTLNANAAGNGKGTGSVDIHTHMPHEYNWSFGIQRQLPNQWLLELNYSGNNSNTLLTVSNPSHFPKGLFVPENSYLYKNASVPSPTAGQVPDNSFTGLRQKLAILEFTSPYFGDIIQEGMNVGTSHFESGQLRIERRFANGFQLLFNYTYSKALDDAGGSDNDFNGNGATGSNGKTFQTVDDGVNSIYGFSGVDEKHRINTFYSYQLPFGRGRKFLGSPRGAGGKLTDALIGGWQLSGDTQYRSGRPLQISVNNSSDGDVIDNHYSAGHLAPGYTIGQLKNSFGSGRPMIVNGSLPAGIKPALDKYAIQGDSINGPGYMQSFTYGNIPSTIGSIRNPGNWVSDLAVMKSFALSKDASRYFQLKLDALNFMNHAGSGQYDINTSDSTYGGISGTGNTERHVQIGGRLVF